MGKLDDACLLRASCAVSFKPSKETTLRTYPLKIGLRYPHNPSPGSRTPLRCACILLVGSCLFPLSRDRLFLASPRKTKRQGATRTPEYACKARR